MKIALVHDWLNQKNGGAEQVLAELADMYPNTPIYTMIYNPELFDYDTERIHTSYLQSMPDFIKSRSRYLLPFIPSAIESWDFSDFDLVISSSAAFAKNIIPGESTLHICYCHSPMRFAWDYWPQYLDEQKIGPLRRSMVRRMVKRLRIWDYTGAGRVDQFIANSRTTQKRIHKYYRRDSEVIYPPVDTKQREAPKDDYYITLGMLTPYKKLDLAIEAFNISGKKLKVIGDGHMRSTLEAMAEDNIEFTGYLDKKALDDIVTQAKGLIFPNKEDFGIAPVEAMAAGTPVIAYNDGGVTETILDGETGILFDEQTPEAINQAVEAAETSNFSTDKLHQQAQKFDRQNFREQLNKFVNRNYG